MPKFSKGHDSGKKHRFFSKVNQVIYSSSPIIILCFNIIAQLVLRYLADKISLHFFLKGTKEHNTDEKKKYGSAIVS